MNTRKTKIVATIGPASGSERELFGMIHAGMNAARIDLSLGTYEEYAKTIAIIRSIAEKQHVAVAIIQDRSDGTFNERKNGDIEFAIKVGSDFLAVSGVKSASEVKKLNDVFKKQKFEIGILAKIDTKEAIDDIDAILAEADGIMVGEAVLAKEMLDESASLVEIEKSLIKKAIVAGKPVVATTPMLESMVRATEPTKLEEGEFMNAIFNGADAVMLSDETAKGLYPVLSVETMARLIMETEKNVHFEEYVEKFERVSRGTVDAISESAASTAKKIKAEAIVALSEKGFTPRMIARYKPSQPIFVLTSHKTTFRKIILTYGCVPEIVEPVQMLTEAVSVSKKLLERKKLLKEGDRFVICAGVPLGHTGGTNMVLIQSI